MALALAVVGLGYVGLPLVREAVRSGHRVTGLDSSRAVVEGLRAGRSHVGDLSNPEVADLLAAGFVPTLDPAALDTVDVVVICVPTPLDGQGSPDLGAVLSASRTVAEHLRPGMLVVLESTTYPGTTDDVVRPLLEASGLVVGRDIHLAFSPERIDPGNTRYTLRNTPKVVGGVTPECGERAAAFYRTVVDEVVVVPRAREAELTKLLENTYRHINIALVNEMAKVCHELGIDVWSVVDAAATKPFGFQSFRPGPGVGGHCIPIDPTFLSFKVREELGYPFRLVELAQQINESMPSFVVSRAAEVLRRDGLELDGSRVLLLGTAYKRDVGDHRESPASEVLVGLVAAGASVGYHDPSPEGWTSPPADVVREVDLESAVADYDLTVLLQDHSSYDLERLVDLAPRFLDTRGRTRSPRADRL